MNDEQVPRNQATIEYLEKRIYVFRKSCVYFSNVDHAFLVSKFLFTSSSLTAFAFLPLAALSLGAALVEVLEKPLKIAQRKEEYRFAYKFYKELLNLYKSGDLNDAEVSK